MIGIAKKKCKNKSLCALRGGWNSKTKWENKKVYTLRGVWMDG